MKMNLTLRCIRKLWDKHFKQGWLTMEENWLLTRLEKRQSRIENES